MGRNEVKLGVILVFLILLRLFPGLLWIGLDCGVVWYAWIRDLFELRTRLGDAWFNRRQHLSVAETKITELKRDIEVQFRHFQDKLYTFVEQRTTIQERLLAKEKEIDSLHERIRQLKSEEQRSHLKNLLSHLSEELALMHQQYDVIVEKASNLETLKKSLEAERSRQTQQLNDLRQNYEKVVTSKNNLETKVSELAKAVRDKENEITVLKSSRVPKEELAEFEKQLVELQKEYDAQLLMKTEFEKKVTELQVQSLTFESKLNSTLTQLHSLTDRHQALQVEAENSLKMITSQEHELSKRKSEIERVDLERRESQIQLQTLQNEFESLQQAYARKVEEQNTMDVKLAFPSDFEQQVVSFVAGKSKKMSKRRRSLLDEEYTTRFGQLYPKAKFYSKFIDDFTALTARERIDVEVGISRLHYQYDSVSPKIRRNSIQTRAGAVLEYEFSKLGRIYFRKENDGLEVYRVTSEGGNHGNQDQVIKWLKQNVV